MDAAGLGNVEEDYKRRGVLPIEFGRHDTEGSLLLEGTCS